jgi:hypothetical protein
MPPLLACALLVVAGCAGIDTESHSTGRPSWPTQMLLLHRRSGSSTLWHAPGHHRGPRRRPHATLRPAGPPRGDGVDHGGAARGICARPCALGVSTLELDTQVTADKSRRRQSRPGHRWHASVGTPARCRWATRHTIVGKGDLHPDARAGARLSTVASSNIPGFEEQEVVTGCPAGQNCKRHRRAVWREAGDPDVWFDIEIKFDPAKAAESVGREEFVRVVVDEINALGIGGADDDPILRLAHADRGAPARTDLAAGGPGREFRRLPGRRWRRGSLGSTVYSPRETIVTRAMIEQAHRAGAARGAVDGR